MPYWLSRAGGRLLGLLEAPMNATSQASNVTCSAPNIVHVHIDGFFAAVEQALRPKLRGKLVLIGRDRVISASYEARLLGISAGMPVECALAFCPAAAVVPARSERYTEFSERLRAILETFAPAVDPDSQHGFYLSFFGSPLLQGDFAGTLRRLQLEILKLAGLNVSIGAAKSKVAAAVASRLERPGGVRIVAPGSEGAFLDALPVEALNGLQTIDGRDLRSRGISTVGELRRVPRPSLELAFGKGLGRQIWHHARGLDARPTKPAVARRAASWFMLPLLPRLF